jgi:YVTN family beta-propeller protein
LQPRTIVKEEPAASQEKRTEKGYGCWSGRPFGKESKLVKHCALALLILCVRISCSADDVVVGPAATGGFVVPTRQLVRPAGSSVEFSGRPVDLVLSPDGRTVYVKTDRSLVVIDVPSWQIKQNLALGSAGKGSYHGVAVTRDGSKLYLTTSGSAVLEVTIDKSGSASLGRTLEVPQHKDMGQPTPCGIALSPGERLAYVCLSRYNALGVLDLGSGTLDKRISVGVAPYDVVVSSDGATAWVSNWGGRLPKDGEKTEKSSGTPTLVDERSVASSGTVSHVDLRQGKELAQVEVGLHPCDLALDAARGLLYVANANSDTVSVIDTKSNTIVRAIDIKPGASLPFGSAPNAIALGKDGRRLYVANGGNNAVAVVEGGTLGFIPTGWYPGAIATDGKSLYIANVKGYGSRDASSSKRARASFAPNAPESGAKEQRPEGGWVGSMFLGTVQKVDVPDAASLAAYTRQVVADARIPQVLRAREKAQSGVKAAPVPERVGEPSLIEHVVYIIKENKTYDQVFGDIAKGNGEPKLCVLGREITPNHHALADQFVLLDNYYCNGACSADGHQWATEGYATDYMEKAFGGWPRSYPYTGNDPLAYSSAGFIWDNVLLHGLSFRNYGEMSTAAAGPKASFKEILEDSRRKTGKFKFTGSFNIETLRRYSCPDYPGWTLSVPDQVRADVFLKELAEAEKTGEWPDFMTILLPNDHTAGTRPGNPSPRAYVADNDLALARIVEGISKSKFWAKTAIFVIEDDPQSGYDHVDGHRSICLMASPYAKRGAVVTSFYNMTSVLHTIELILGIPPMNQMDAMAPVMRDCFADKPDLTPYTALPNNSPLDEVNPEPSKLSGKALYWANAALSLELDEVDKADNDALNRMIWHSVKGFDAPYPVEFVSTQRRMR